MARSVNATDVLCRGVVVPTRMTMTGAVVESGGSGIRGVTVVSPLVMGGFDGSCAAPNGAAGMLPTPRGEGPAAADCTDFGSAFADHSDRLLAPWSDQ